MDGFEQPERRKPIRSLGQRINWGAPQAELEVPIKQVSQHKDRMLINQPPVELNFMDDSALQALVAQIKAEEAQPPHLKNQAKINALKQQAFEMMKRLESKWVQKSADKLLPRLNESQDC